MQVENVLVLGREDLQDDFKEVPIDQIELYNFKNINKYSNYDVILFKDRKGSYYKMIRGKYYNHIYASN